MSNKKGFTLIETLFVLFVICHLSLISMNFHVPLKSNELIIEEISQFILQAKMNAMMYKETTKIQFSDNTIHVSSNHFNDTYLITNHLFFDHYEMTYNANGNIKTAKSLTLYSDVHEYQFVFQVGCGSFYVKS